MAAKQTSKFILAFAVLCTMLLITSTSHAGASTGASVAPNMQAAQLSTSAAFTSPTPTITGNLSVGSTLTANTGVWTPTPTSVTYQWKRGGVPIANLATGSTYKLNAFDVGYAITVTVTGVKSGYTTTSKTSNPTARIALGSLNGPVPTISGTTAVGQTLSVNLGSWNPSPDSLTYQWKRNGAPIANNSTGSTYKLNSFDRGNVISVTVTGSKNGYSTVTRTSASTRAISYGTITATDPYITGGFRVGSTLTAWMGSWSINPDYRIVTWYRNGQPIPYANGSNYTLTVDDAGAAISVSVTGGKAGYTEITRSSAARSEWETVLISTTVSAWSVFQNCYSLGDSYDPLDAGNMFGSSDGVRIYSSGFGDFMDLSCGIHLQGSPTAWSLNFGGTWKGDAPAAFLYVATDPNGSAGSWNANMWFPLREMDVYGEDVSTPISYSSYSGNVYFSIMSTDWASIYMDTVTITYLTIL